MVVLDTHAWVWWLGGSERLGAAARRLTDAISNEQPAVVSAFSVFEVATAVRRGRLALSLPLNDWLAESAALPELRFEPVTPAIAERAGSIGDELHGDPGDRLIAATAMHLAVPLVTGDKKLRKLRGLKTIW